MTSDTCTQQRASCGWMGGGGRRASKQITPVKQAMAKHYGREGGQSPLQMARSAPSRSGQALVALMRLSSVLHAA
eukprot:11596856-Alexandrium_andersonii.AAC.1